jgi:hypothetical protein
MIAQLDLFSRRPAPRPNRKPQAIRATSLEARDSIRMSSNDMRKRVLAAIEARGRHGATDHELAAQIPMQLQTVNPRRGELVTAGLVVNSGRRRATLAGRSAIVWVAAAFSGAA